MRNAHDAGETRHPQTVVSELAESIGFTILAAVPQSLFDGWDFWVEFEESVKDIGPLFRGYPWKPVGQV